MGAADSGEKKRIQDRAKGCRYGGGLPMSTENGDCADCEAGYDQEKFESAKCGQPLRRWEKEREIFGPAFAQLGEGAIHAGADGIRAVAEEDFSAGLLDGVGESDVFQQIPGEGSVPA